MDTPITRLLDAASVPYRRLPHQEPVYTMETAAASRGLPVAGLVKSILLREKDNRYVMACVPGDRRVDPRAVRAALPAGWRRLRFATAEEIEQVTGCVQGAVAPLALPAGLPVIFDASLAAAGAVSISSGDPWLGVELDAADLIRLAGGVVAPIAEPA